MTGNKITNVSDRLQSALQHRNMRQIELAERSGIHRSMINNYISGRCEPKQQRLKALADALDVSEIWLAGYDVGMEKEQKNKNDDLAQIIIRLRTDNDFYSLVSAIYKLNVRQFKSLKDLITAFLNK